MIFPLYISLNSYIDINDKKLYFVIKLFGFIKVASGYAHFCKYGIAIHISKKKAILIEFAKMFGLRKSIKPVWDLHLVSLNILIENQNKLDANIYFVNSVIGLLSGILEEWIALKKPYLDYRLKFNSVNERENLIFISSLAIFNLLIVLLTLFKFIGEKLFYGFRKAKQN